MITPFIAAISVAILGAVRTDEAVGVREEVAVGSAPPNPAAYKGENRATLTSLTIPSAGIRQTSSRTELIVKYFPRLYLRYPNIAGADRVLTYHRGGLATSHVLSSNVGWSFSSTVGQGELDYAAPQFIAGDQAIQTVGSANTAGAPQTSQGTQTGTTSVLVVPVLTMRTLNATTALAWQESRRMRLSTSFSVTGTTPLSGRNVLPNGSVWIFGPTVTQEYSVSPRDNTGLALAWLHSDTQRIVPDYDSINAIANWTHATSVSSETGAFVGVGFIHLYGHALMWTPSAWLTWKDSELPVSGMQRTVQLSGGVRTIANTLVGTVTPTAFAQATVLYTLSRDWSFDALLSALVPVSKATTSTYAQPAITTGNWQSIFHRRLSQVFNLDFGIRGSFFANGPVVSSFSVLSTQSWAFLGFTYAEGTDKENNNRWLF